MPKTSTTAVEIVTQMSGRIALRAVVWYLSLKSVGTVPPRKKLTVYEIENGAGMILLAVERQRDGGVEIDANIWGSKAKQSRRIQNGCSHNNVRSEHWRGEFAEGESGGGRRGHKVPSDQRDGLSHLWPGDRKNVRENGIRCFFERPQSESIFRTFGGCQKEGGDAR